MYKKLKIVFLFLSTILMAYLPISYSAEEGLAYKVSQGTVFEIDSEKTAELGTFERVPKVYVSRIETKEVHGKKVIVEIKKYVKVLTKQFPIKKIECEWVVKAEPGIYSLYVIPANAQKKSRAVLVSNNFEIKAPENLVLNPNHAGTATEISATGSYFGTKKPKIWLQYLNANNKLKKITCKPYDFSMKPLEADGGESQLKFLSPKLIPGMEYDFYLKNLIGETSAKFIGSNSAPVAVDDSVSMQKNTLVYVTVLANDSDLDNDALLIISVSDPANGIAIVNNGQTITYTPKNDFVGNDNFQYTVKDTGGLTASANVFVTVKEPEANNSPVAVDDTASAESGFSVQISVLLNDSDSDGDPLTVVETGKAAHGNAEIIYGGAKILYTPNDGYSGRDEFTYTISDGRGGTASAEVSVSVIKPNDSPQAIDDNAQITKNTAIEINVLENDSDPDDDKITVTQVGTPSHGTAAISSNGTKITYTPANGYAGMDSFQYTISDIHSATDTATVYVKVYGGGTGNNSPTAFNDSASTSLNTPVEISVLANDIDEDGDEIFVSAVSEPTHGVSSIVDGAKIVLYTPASDWSGTDSFNYTVSDANGGSNTASVKVVVLAVADGEYLVIDLSAGSSAQNYPYEFFSSAPSDLLTNSEYKTSKIALRKISSGSFTMGSPVDEIGRLPGENQHNVQITKPFYIGVFETTQSQYFNVMGINPSEYKGEKHPVDKVSWEIVRGGAWPSGTPSQGSFFGVLNKKTGFLFDLPTEAQWEYACRAGTTTALNIGYNLVTPAYCPYLNSAGWYYFNSYEAHHREVGQKTANAWGLYDMHGNVWEWCLDYYAEYKTDDQKDPVGPAVGEARILRGGNWNAYSLNCRSAARNYRPPTVEFSNIGFRIVLTE